MHGVIESGYRIELRPLADLAAVAAAVRELAADAAAPNVFYEPAFMAAAAPVFGRGVQLGLVWRRGTPGRLAGMFPVEVQSRRYGLRLPLLAGWTHPFAPLGVPLLARDDAEAAVSAWLDHIADDPGLPKLLLMPQLPTGGRVAEAFGQALAARGGENRTFDRKRRALLVPGPDRAGYFDRSIGAKKRKDLRRQRRRLAETGVLVAAADTDPAGVAAGLADFLRLEDAGWKGRAGTAAQTHAAIAAFLQRAVHALAAEGKASAARLLLDRRAIAALLVLRSGDTAWFWKIAYDESFARTSPGVQLVLDASERILADPTLTQADSCAAPDHPMIDHLWRERLELADWLICPQPGDRAAFVWAGRLEQLRRSAFAAAKRCYRLLRKD